VFGQQGDGVGVMVLDGDERQAALSSLLLCGWQATAEEDVVRVRGWLQEEINGAARTENIVALCDVDLNRAAASIKRFEKLPFYKDFRVMLDKEGKNIDACTMGIPDFMHATVALACMQRGKHVYVVKPLTRTPLK